LGDKAAVVDRQGKISQGNVGDIITEERLRDVYDIDLHLEYVREINRVACFAPELNKNG
jgi:iron complex transport system ATP-binding protein